MPAESQGLVPEWRRDPISRPNSVTGAMAIMYCLTGLAFIGCGVVGLIATKGSSTRPSSVLWLLVALLVGAGLLNGVLGYQVGQGKPWARIATVAFNGLGIGVSVVNLTRGNTSSCCGMIINVVVIGLLSTQSARSYFRGPG